MLEKTAADARSELHNLFVKAGETVPSKEGTEADQACLRVAIKLLSPAGEVSLGSLPNVCESEHASDNTWEETAC